MTSKYSKFPIIFSQILFYSFMILGAFEFFVPNFQRAADVCVSLLISVFAYVMYVKYTMDYEKCEIREFSKCKESGCEHDIEKPKFISDSILFIVNLLLAIVTYIGLVVCVYKIYTFRWISLVSLIIYLIAISLSIVGTIRMIIILDSNKSLFRIKYFNDHSTTFEVISKSFDKMVWDYRDNKAKKEVRKDLIKQGVDPEAIDNDELF